MKEESSSRLAQQCKIASAAASVFSAAVGLSGLAGSALHIRIFVTWGVEPVTMKANTAACFLLASISLWLQREETQTSHTRRLAGRIGAALLGLIALLSWLEFFLDRNLRIDQLLIPALPDSATYALRPGLMSPITAFNFLIFAVALLLIDWRTKNQDWPAQYLCGLGALGASFGVLGLFLEPLATSVTLAVPTAVCFVALTCGIVCSRANWAIGGLLTSPSQAARWMRRTGPIALAVLIFFGWLLWRPLLTSEHFTWIQVSAIALLATLLLAAFILWTALLLDRSDRERKRAEEALHLTPEMLNRLAGRYKDSPVETTIRRWSTGGIALAILLTIFGGFLSWRSVRQATEDSNLVAHTQAVNAALEATLAHAVDVETGTRSFSATGDETLLEPFFSGQRSLHSDLEMLTALIADNSVQQQRLHRLRPQIDARVAIAEETIAERQRTGAVPSTAIFLQGKQRMDAVRSTIDEMRAEEARLLGQRTKRSEAARRQTTSITLISTLSGILLLVFAGLVTSQQIGHSAKLRGQIQALNADLERRVEERTAALRESEERFQAMVNGIPQLAWMAEADGHIFWYNRRWFDYTGTTLEEMKGWGWQRVHDPKTLPSVLQRWRASIAGGNPFDMEFPLCGADGRYRMFLTRVLPLKDSAGRVVRWFGTSTDISELKLAEDKIRESQEQFRDLFNEMLTGFALLEAIYDETGKPCDFRYLEVNPAFEKHCGIPRDKVMGKTIREILPTLEPIWIETYGQVAATGESIHFENYAEPLDRWLELIAFRTRKGQVAVTFADVTERKLAEEKIRKLNQELEERVQQRTAQLHESEQGVRRKLDSILSPESDLGSLELSDILDIPAIQQLLDSFYSVVHVTTALLDLKGNILTAVGWQDICVKFHRLHRESCQNCEESDLQLSAGAVPGEFKIYKCKNNMWDVATPIVVGDHHMGNLFCGQFLFADESIDYELFRAQARKHGFNEQEYIAALEAVPRLSKEEVNASMAFLAKLAQMISQLSYSTIKLARSSTQLGRANADLAASNKELEAFTYSVSHDLRAPLRHISGFTKMLAEEFGPALPPEAQHYLERIQGGTHRMGVLVDDLLNLGRVGRQTLSLQVAGLRSIVDEIISELHSECADREVDWKIGALPFLDCDPGLLKQVFQNLLSNALKFTRPRPRAIIEIGQEEQDGAQVIYVRDNGVGFSMKYVDKLFGVFQRLHRAEDFEGNGVGLATVQRIVQKHGGRIWAEAELDKGATFYFTVGNRDANQTKTQAAVAGEKS